MLVHSEEHDQAFYTNPNKHTIKVGFDCCRSVVHVPLQRGDGRVRYLDAKGNVIWRMCADIEADVFVLVDGDDTYDATIVPRLVNRLITENLEMGNGARIAASRAAYRSGHQFGNALLTGLVAKIFGNRPSDMLSGHRVSSWRFVKSFPTLTTGFEV